MNFLCFYVNLISKFSLDSSCCSIGTHRSIMASMAPPNPPGEGGGHHKKYHWQHFWDEDGSRKCKKCKKGRYFWKIGCNNEACVAKLQLICLNCAQYVVLVLSYQGINMVQHNKGYNACHHAMFSWGYIYIYIYIPLALLRKTGRSINMKRRGQRRTEE